MGILGDLVVRIVGDDKQFKDAVGKSESKVKKFTNFLKGAAGIGGAILIFKKLVDVAGDLVDAYKIQEVAEAKLKSALKATHNAVGISADEMFRYAQEMQQVTVMGDEAIIGAQALMTTFTKVGKNVFPEAIEAAADMSTMFGQDLQQSVIQLGTALNDPIAGVGRLKRIGISFSEEQKKSIEIFMEQNDVAGAQGVILAELKNEFGGVSKAMADTATGSMQQFKNAMSDLKEVGGKMVAEGLQPVVKWLTKVVQKAAASAKEIDTINKALKQMAEGGMDAVENKKAALAGLEKQWRDIRDQLEKVNKEQVHYINGVKVGTSGVYRSAEALEKHKVALAIQIVQMRSRIREEEKLAKAKAEGNRKAQAEAEAEIIRLKELMEWQDKIKEKYDGTAKGKEEILAAEIAWYEYWLPRSEVYKEHIKTILEGLYEQRDTKKEITEDETKDIERLNEIRTHYADLEKARMDAIAEFKREKREEEEEAEKEHREKIQEDEVAAIAEIYAARKDAWDKRIARINAAYDAKKEALAAEVVAEEEAAAEMLKIKKQLTTAVSNLYNTLITAIGKMWANQLATELALLTEKYDYLTQAEIDYNAFLAEQAQERYDNMTEEEQREYDLKEAALAAEKIRMAALETEKKQLIYDEAVRQKELATFQTVVNTAAAIIKMLIDPGGWPGVGLSIAAGFKGAAQLAVINSQPLPALAEGGIIHEPTVLLAGERGPEKITPLGEEQPIIIGISIDGRALDATITRNVGNRRILIAKGALV